jgi:hypothetical protein
LSLGWASAERNEIVSNTNIAPSFKACETQRGADWSVLVTWPDQRQQYLDGFQSFDETVAWVQDKSQAWLEAQQLHTCPSAPRRHDHIWSRFERSISRDERDEISRASNAKVPEPREGDAIDQLINVIDSHKDAAKEDRKARGDTFKDEQSSE